MAYWQRKPNGSVAVYYKDTAKGKVVPIPRKKIYQLDELQDQEIDKWVARWARLNEARKLKPSIRQPSPEVEVLIEEYLSYLKDLEKRPNTIFKHQGYLKRVAAYYGDIPLAQWPETSWNLGKWIRGNGDSPGIVKRTHQTFLLFWEWLVNTGHCEGFIRLPKTPSPRKNKTPLKHLFTPEEVLKFVLSSPHPKIQFMALMGYFFSLRPQETFILTAEDFAAGEEAEGLPCCQYMAKAKLYNKLAVYVYQQKAVDGVVDTKTKDTEYVACFDKRAAKLVVGLLNEGFGGVGFTTTYCWKYWNKHGIPNCSLKDLRRASVHWLGHETDLKEMALMNHARHADFNTTRDYLRRPEKQKPLAKGKLDLGD
jgi:hypothetical protein